MLALGFLDVTKEAFSKGLNSHSEIIPFWVLNPCPMNYKFSTLTAGTQYIPSPCETYAPCGWLFLWHQVVSTHIYSYWSLARDVWDPPVIKLGQIYPRARHIILWIGNTKYYPESNLSLKPAFQCIFICNSFMFILG